MMRVVQVFLVTLIVGIPKARAIDGAVGADGVRQFLKNHCIRCHGEEKQKGKLALHDVSFNFAKAGNSDLWLEILTQLTA